MNIVGEKITQQMESYLEEKLACFKALLDLTREQVSITKEEHINLKSLELILQQKEDRLARIKEIDHLLKRKGLSESSAINKEKTVPLVQIMKEMVSLEEVSYQSLFHSQLSLREELVDHHRKKGLRKLYINRVAQTAAPKFMEREI